MKKTKKHIILFGILLIFYSGQILARTESASFIEKQSVQKQSVISSLLKNDTFLDTVKYPIKEDFKKGTITVDNEEEEIEGMVSKKIAEKSKLIFCIFSQLSTNSFQNITISLFLFNDIISHLPHNSLYLLFEDFRI
jgi:hypothetical protein